MAITAPSESAAEHAWCGTDGSHSSLLEAEARHRLFERRAERLLVESRRPDLTGSQASALACELISGPTGAQASGPSIRKEGKVAVI